MKRRHPRFVLLDYSKAPAVAAVYVGRTQESVWTIDPKRPLTAREVEALRVVDPNLIAPPPGEAA